MKQRSQKRKLDVYTGDSANAPNLCANDCGFFGSASTNNLCSKCYKGFLTTQSTNSAETNGRASPTESKLVEGVGSASDEIPDKIPTANRCGFCRRRVGQTGFKCRCGETFCSMHRYSDKHNCVFDYKSAGQDAITKANPIVKADKIGKI